MDETYPRVVHETVIPTKDGPWRFRVVESKEARNLKEPPYLYELATSVDGMKNPVWYRLADLNEESMLRSAVNQLVCDLQYQKFEVARLNKKLQEEHAARCRVIGTEECYLAGGVWKIKKKTEPVEPF